MKLVSSTGNPRLAMVHVAADARGRRVEFVDSVQPPRPRSEKWVVIVSTMFGCPVGCRMCDAGGWTEGRLNAAEILWQVRTAVGLRFPSGRPQTRMLKIQMARMGEPSLNPSVIEALAALPAEFPGTRVTASVSTVAPRRAERFVERLRQIKDLRYSGGRFQLQFSIHSTDPEHRSWLCPVESLSLHQMAAIGKGFRAPGDRKITLNFCLIEGFPIDMGVIRDTFDPEDFVIKLTPLNPTAAARRWRLSSLIGPGTESRARPLVDALAQAGFDVLLSIGEYDENTIGSNCGQYAVRGPALPSVGAGRFTARPLVVKAAHG
ncbi:MAG: radical SAM protein [Candidatus Zixiibacteriota bacterium]